MKYCYLLLCLFLLVSCEKIFDKDPGLYKYPGEYILDVSLHPDGNLWFISGGRDTKANPPPEMSSIPQRYYLSEYNFDTYRVFDNWNLWGYKLEFDNSGRLWLLSSRDISCYDNDNFHLVRHLKDRDGYYLWTFIDQDQNIWSGGFCEELVQINQDLTVKVFTGSQSGLPSTMIQCAYMDMEGRLWLGIKDNGIGYLSRDGNWVGFPEMSENQFIAITGDPDGNIWAGCGANDSSKNLYRFNGSLWELFNPKYDNGSTVNGSVRLLYHDGSKLWAVSDLSYFESVVTVYSNSGWESKELLPDKGYIAKIVFDNENNRLWVLSHKSEFIEYPN